MLRSILLGIDGSAYNVAALNFGLRLAKQTDALLVGLGIVDEPTIREGEMVPIGAGAFKSHRDETLIHDARRQIEGFLEGFTLRCAQEGVASKVLEDVGDPIAQIRLEAQRFDLIMLGQQTYFRFETQEFADDTLKEILRYSPRPVLVVPGKPRSGKNVLVAYDGSLPSARTLQLFVSLGLAQDREIHVLTVNDDGVEAARIADRAVEFLRFHSIIAQRHALTHGKTAVAGAILERAKTLNAELLVLGAYGQSTLREFFFGSVTSSILQESDVAMFMCH